MIDKASHSTCVDAWLHGAACLGTGSLLQLFDAALRALWLSGQLTLGDITLAAIADRVLHAAVERYPVLSCLKVEESGFSCWDLQERARERPRAEVEPWLRFVLVEFLTVSGNLTAEILTPSLHSALLVVAPAVEATGGPPGAPPADPGFTGKDVKP